jgi:hypothetical protein
MIAAPLAQLNVGTALLRKTFRNYAESSPDDSRNALPGMSKWLKQFEKQTDIRNGVPQIMFHGIACPGLEMARARSAQVRSPRLPFDHERP